jgi:hypothetical protein
MTADGAARLRDLTTREMVVSAIPQDVRIVLLWPTSLY